MKRAGWHAGMLALTFCVPIAATQAAPLQWPDTPAARDAATARIDQLKQQLMSQPSATLVLARWCAAYHLAPAPQIIARRILGPAKPLPEAVRLNLALKPGEATGYRRVQLLCGGRILSDAENWYLPDRLTPSMNQTLDHTDTPFGLAVRSLHFKRRTLSSETLWVPAPPATPGDRMTVPEHLLRNEGLLTVAGGLPISQVIENYTAAILGAPP
jgi:chorismate-pyruvate lyase